jgi:ABC-type spermidine/putrescine transport system permease subunit I
MIKPYATILYYNIRAELGGKMRSPWGKGNWEWIGTTREWRSPMASHVDVVVLVVVVSVVVVVSSYRSRNRF